MSCNRAALLVTACLAAWAAPDPAWAQRPPRAARPAPAPAEGTISAVRVEGNQRIESGTIRSYMLVSPGDSFDPERIDRSLKTLYATGLFQDVMLRRDGNALVVTVVENPIVNRIVFEGNRKLKDDQLRAALQLRQRAVYTPQLAQADRQRILDLYAGAGRFAATVEPKVVRRDQNRADVVFEINEGDATLVSRIAFVGNRAFSENRLREVVASREQAFYRILSSSDQYDPERVSFDRELLRRFYLKNGFADVEVTGAAAELAPDRESFFLTFTINEGERYRIGEVGVESKLRNVTGEELRPLIEISPGDTYDGDAVERNVERLTTAVQNRGFAFVEVRPRIARNREKGTVDLVFDVSEGPRVFVERIDITGNTRTKDKVIRREFRMAEGDAFNSDAVRRSRLRLQDLGYFNTATVTPSQGSAPDRAILTAAVDEKATGELTLGGGFSTDAGALVNVGLRERNLIGTGIDAGINGVLAQRRSEIDLTVTDPYFLDRNLVAGFDVFHVRNNNQNIASYDERRTGFSLRLGYEFNEFLRQAWTYSLVDRNINVRGNVEESSIYIQDQGGGSTLSQLGQTLAYDRRDSRTDPREGYLLRVGSDFAGLGGTARYIRGRLDGNYYIPLERYTGDSDWSIALSAGVGYLFRLGKQERIIDRFFLGGDNLRGFESGGAGPHSIPNGQNQVSDSLGGRFIYTQTTELRFPLPISSDFGLSGRAFVDVGGLSQSARASTLRQNGVPITQSIQDSASPRVGAGVGVSWRTPFGLINVDLAQAVVKQRYDQTQFFRFGFGTRF